MQEQAKTGKSYPKISVITACYNGEKYIEQTLSSVLNQGYPNLEYIVIDGASKDRTFEIIKNYRHQLSYFVSEPDDGQYHAIQKGLEMATGDIMCWLNADDIMMPWTLSVVGEVFSNFPDVQWVTGQPSFLNRLGQLTSVYGANPTYPRHFIANGWYSRHLGGFLQQESMFWRKSLFDKAGGLDCSLDLAADYELWTRFARHADLTPISIPLSSFRKLPNEQRSSVSAQKYDQETKDVSKRLKKPPLLWSAIASTGLIGRSLARLSIRRKGSLVTFDEASEAWRLTQSRRSISRVSWGTLKENYSLRKSR